MLIIPMTNKINWKNPPIVTIIIILLNVFIFFIFQKNDHQMFVDSHEYYLKSGLAQIEVPRYIDYLSVKNNKPLIDAKDLKPKTIYKYHFKMEQDFEFLQQLENHKIIERSDPKFIVWKEKRAEYKKRRDKSVAFKYGLKPAYFKVVNLFTSMFLHGSVMHLLGNMVFLWLVGCILEVGCGRHRYAIAYVISGVCSAAFFKLVYFHSTMPLVGASGAIAGLMGMLAILYGKKTIRVFFSLGFFFNYIRIRAIFLFLLWIGNELIQLFFGQASNVAYVAHIGGLLSGGLSAFVLLKIPNAVDHDIFEDQVQETIGPMIESALEKIVQLDLTGATEILYRALQKDPGNLQVLIQLFKIYKQSPEKKEFHEITEMAISSLIKNRNDYFDASKLFMEYQNTVKTMRLSSQLLVRMCFVWCELEKPDQAGKMVMRLIKANKKLPGLPTALLKISFAFRKNGKMKNFKKCQDYILLKYPNSQEASLVLDSKINN